MIINSDRQYLLGNLSYDNETEINLLKPKEMKEFLDEYVIGQEDAKKVLSVPA